MVTIAAPEEPIAGEPDPGDQHAVDDQAAGIDWTLARHEVAGSPFEGRVDRDRIVAAGNSCGGITSLATRDRRVSAVFVLSGSSVPPGASRELAVEVVGELRAPVGDVVGDRGSGIDDDCAGPRCAA